MSKKPTLTRDQERAQFAYEGVGAITDKAQQKDYKIAVHTFGADILRSGLAAAVAGLERRKAKSDNKHKKNNEPLLLVHLAKAGIPGLGGDCGPAEVPARIRALPLDDYILATRETLQVVLWLKRAVQAKFEGV